MVTFEHVVDGDEDGIGESTGVEDFGGFVECGLWPVDVTVGDVDYAARAEDEDKIGEYPIRSSKTVTSESLPSCFAQTLDDDGGLLLRRNVLLFVLVVPGEYRPADQLVFRLISIENGHLALCQCLLCWRNRRILERKADEVNGQ